LIEFADGIEEAGYPELARRSRMSARDVLELAEQVREERSARVALQARAETLQSIVGKAAYDACREAAP
jgi:hypothetical protein